MILFDRHTSVRYPTLESHLERYIPLSFPPAPRFDITWRLGRPFDVAVLAVCGAWDAFGSRVDKAWDKEATLVPSE